MEEYPKLRVVLANLVVLIWLALGTAICWLVSPLAGWVYGLVALLIVFVILRKLACVNCYYYGRWCSMGWGKIAACLFKKGRLEKFEDSFGLKLAPLFYGLLTVVPLVIIVVLMIRGFTKEKLVLFLLLVLVSVYSATVSRKVACTGCKMKFICPGSAG